jgi:hypothetical protein
LIRVISDQPRGSRDLPNKTLSHHPRRVASRDRRLVHGCAIQKSNFIALLFVTLNFIPLVTPNRLTFHHGEVEEWFLGGVIEYGFVSRSFPVDSRRRSNIATQTKDCSWTNCRCPRGTSCCIASQANLLALRYSKGPGKAHPIPES